MASLGTEMMKLGAVSAGELDQDLLMLCPGMIYETILVPKPKVSKVVPLVCYSMNAKFELPFAVVSWWPCLSLLDTREVSVAYSWQCGRIINDVLRVIMYSGTQNTSRPECSEQGRAVGIVARR
jgi:hypothetical protein